MTDKEDTIAYFNRADYHLSEAMDAIEYILEHKSGTIDMANELQGIYDEIGEVRNHIYKFADRFTGEKGSLSYLP